MCPVCNSRNSKVVNTRKYEDHIWRRKQCKDCGRFYSTQEVAFAEHRQFTEGVKALKEQCDYINEKMSLLSSYHAKENY